MSWNNVLPWDLFLQPPVWQTTPVEQVPAIKLRAWRVVEVVPGNDHHFIGYNMTEGEGRVSSKIVDYDKSTRIGVTSSGRRYELVGESGFNMDAEHTYAYWQRINGVENDRDISEEYE